MNRVLYSQCWEDPRLLLKALQVGPGDDVLSIASAGDNSLALLLGDPRSVTAIDVNPAQLCLIELKIVAMRQLGYADFVRFVGAQPCHDREVQFRALVPFLSVLTADFWMRRLPDIRTGVIHCGRFERYLAAFRRYVLPLIHRGETVSALLSSDSIDAQKEIYRELWDNQRWRWLFRVFFGRTAMAGLGRQREFFEYVTRVDVASTLYGRVRRGLTDIPIRDNFFVEYILTGQYRSLQSAPMYLHPTYFEIIKSRLDRLRFVCASLGPWLTRQPAGALTQFNLSDVFEYMAPDVAAATLREIVRVSRPGGRLAYWTLFVDRPVPENLRTVIASREAAQDQWCDRAFFYDQFLTCTVGGGAA